MKPPYSDAAQRKAVELRDEGICRMERQFHGEWLECGRSPGFRAHVYRRHHSGADKYHPDLVVTACNECHANVDDRNVPRTYPTRFPPDTARRAYARIVATGAPPPKRDPEGRAEWKQPSPGRATW